MGRPRVLAAVLLVAGLASPTAAPAQEIRTTVAAPDGTALATDVYFPILHGLGPYPVVLQRTPYGRQSLNEVCRVFNLLGFACVAQDVRGRGGSEGMDTVFRDDGPDGRATLAWIAVQPWCDGNIGTFGGSALGITQYALSPGAPSQLRCTMPTVATPDFYQHGAFQGGALREALTYNWLAGQGSLYVYDELKAHRLLDDWWEWAEILPDAGSVDVPGLHVGGWYDIFLQGTLDAFRAFQHAGGPGAQGRQHLIIGPWTHGIGGRTAGELIYPANATLDLGTITRDWYDHWLRGGSPGVASWPACHVYLMGAAGETGAPGNTWIDLPDWPPPAVLNRRYLGDDGTLRAASPVAGSVELPIDPANPVPTLGGANLHPGLVVDGRPMGAGPHDERSIEARSDVVTFTTEVLDAPVTVMGPVRVRLWIVPDTTDLDLAVRLADVYPDGRSMLVTDGIQRARKRCGIDRECFLTPGQPVELVVDLWSTALVFNSGHRIRISVSGSNAPRFEVNPNHGGDLDGDLPPVAARPSILTGDAHPSALELPVVATPRASRRRSAR